MELPSYGISRCQCNQLVASEHGSMGVDIPKRPFSINSISSLAGNCGYIDMGSVL